MERVGRVAVSVSGGPAPVDGAVGFAPEVWIRLAVLGAIFIAVHIDIISRLVRFAATDGDWSHAFLVPVLGAWLIWQDRRAIVACQPRTCWTGLIILIAALSAYIAGLYPLQSDMVKGYAMVAGLAGLTLLMVGPSVMRRVWFAIALLVLAVKIFPPVWEAAAWQMQLMAARASVTAINILGMEAELDGTRITLWDGRQEVTVTVAAACSGMRMMMAFLTVGLVVAYAGRRPVWARGVLAGLTVPIAIVVNVGRVVVLALLARIDVRFAGGDLHTLIGMLMLLPGVGLFLLAAWALEKACGEPKGPGQEAAGCQVRIATESERPVRVLTPPFLAATAVLLLAAWAVPLAMASMDVRLVKHPAALRRHLYLLPDAMGPYTRTGEDRMTADMAAEFDARQYIRRSYRDTSVPANAPGSVVRLYVSYHTGWADSRPHVPLRLALLNEPRPDPSVRVNVPLDSTRSAGEIPLELAQAGPDAAPVAHFYIANGKALRYGRDVVRHLSDPRVRRAWWCRVEVQPLLSREPREAYARAERFLAQAMPHILALLPEQEEE